jgi:hypothetical protein
MRKSIVIAVLFAAISLIGCSSDVGEHGSLLLRVNEQEMTSQVLYFAPDVSPVPLTEIDAQEMGVELTLATPVRVEIYDEVAVAWYAPEGEALIGRDHIAALWRVVDRTEIDGELRPGEVPEIEQPTAPVEQPYSNLQIPSFATPLGTDLQDTSDVAVTDIVGPSAIINFINTLATEEEIELMQGLEGAHPGCLQ